MMESISSDSGHRIGSISSCLLRQIHPSSLGHIRFFPAFCRHPSPIYSRQAPGPRLLALPMRSR